MSESVKQALERIENSDTTEDLRAEYLVVRNYIEALEGLLKAASCPCCDGSGAYLYNDGVVVQCQWCDETKKLLEAGG